MKKTLIILSILIGFQCFGQSIESPARVPAGIDKVQLRYADKVIQQSIQNKEIPGAVLAVVFRNKLVYMKAYGNKQIYPESVKMKTNTVFDLASLTKSVATATSIMILTERGRLRLEDKVSQYFPYFKDNISILNLLTHTSGLPPYAPVDSLEKNLATHPDTLTHYIASCKRSFEPGKGFQYSCLNFITLQKIIEKVSGQNLKDFAQTNIFDELGMRHTGFCPTGETLKRTAPTQKQSDNHVLLGEVHDPLARKLNHGISGNAGLFSDAKDLALFSAMLLNHGTLNNKRVLSPLAVNTLTTLPIGLSEYGRTPGWDLFSSYSSNQGDLLGPNAYGHTGYTGTSIVIDPDNQVAVILLTNRVHPDDKGSVARLRALVANVVAGAVKFE
ncbi:MAG: serine hydrolase domain-containing protein [Paludibacter sp.]|nr:serine hydrolase domain-containing protein [Paludibacter sp.]